MPNCVPVHGITQGSGNGYDGSGDHGGGSGDGDLVGVGSSGKKHWVRSSLLLCCVGLGGYKWRTMVPASKGSLRCGVDSGRVMAVAVAVV